MGMRAQFVIPVLASILILGLIGYSQEAEAASMIFTEDTTIEIGIQLIDSGETWTINPGVTLTVNCMNGGVCLIIADGGTIDNSGTFILANSLSNLGTFNNFLGGTINIILGVDFGTIGFFGNIGITNNSGTINIIIGNFGNSGILNNDCTGVIIGTLTGDPPIDVCDSDGDGVIAEIDNCPNTPNPDQTDTDEDGVGDACNDADDADGDEIRNSLDNCPLIPNQSQEDSNDDGVGDVCEGEDLVLMELQQINQRLDGLEADHDFLTQIIKIIARIFRIPIP